MDPTSSWNTSVPPSAISWGVGRLDVFLADPTQTTLTHVWQDSSVTRITWNTNVLSSSQQALAITAALTGFGHFNVFYEGIGGDISPPGLFEAIDLSL